jgi:hypothetical protein
LTFFLKLFLQILNQIIIFGMLNIITIKNFLYELFF